MADAKNPPEDKHDEALPRISCSEQNPPRTADSAPQHLKNSHDDAAAQDSVDRPPPLPPPDCNDADVTVESQDPEDLRPQTPRSDQPSSQLPLPTSVPAHDTPSIVATANPLPDASVQCVKLKPEDDNAVDAKNEVMPLSPRQSPENHKPLDDGQDQEFGDDEPRKFKDDSSVPYLIQKQVPQPLLDAENQVAHDTPTKSFLLDSSSAGDGYESGTEEEQAAFMKDVQYFYKDNGLDFKPPKFYKEELNLLKLWRAVIKLGGYEQVTSCKLWRQVGESFRPPKTCTTVSWTFRIFYEKALLEYEKHKMQRGELPFSDGSLTESVRVENQACGSQALGTGRARRDAAARAMQGWHSQRLLGNGQVFHPIIKDKNLSSTLKGDKQLKTNGLLKRKKPSTEHAVHVGHIKTTKPQGDVMVIDIGPAADWVKINVQKTNDCFEVYALVPGLLREEVHVQSDPAGRLIISGQPEELDNPWGVTPFKKVVSLPTRIDPHQTSAVVTLHGQLFVRVPFEQSDF